MKATSNADGFATFLGGFTQAEPSLKFTADTDWVAPTVPAQQPSVPSSVMRNIIHQLAASGAQPLSTFMTVARLPFSTFADAIEALRAADLVRLSGEPGRESIELTPVGRHVALLEL